jgi:hypothetical protein
MALDKAQLRREIVAEIREIVGPGLVPDYYGQFAEPFILIAEATYREGVEDGKNESH